MYYLKFNVSVKTIIANLIGGLIFFGVDKYIFKSSVCFPLWEIQENIKCVDCGKVAKGFRLVKTKNYDRTKDQNPEFRCSDCSSNKLLELNKRGVYLTSSTK